MICIKSKCLTKSNCCSRNKDNDVSIDVRLKKPKCKFLSKIMGFVGPLIGKLPLLLAFI